MIRYNFKLTEARHKIDLDALPPAFGLEQAAVYGVDACRLAFFLKLDSPAPALRFLNRLWNLTFSATGDDNLKQVAERYGALKKYHSVIAAARKSIRVGGLSPLVLDVLYPFIPHIVTEIKANARN